MTVCRGCLGTRLDPVLDLGRVPAADDFPAAGSAPGDGESLHPLSMTLCRDCGLAQLAADDTTVAEPRGVEPAALRSQAAAAVAAVAAGGWLRGRTVVEFGSPHGGSWLPLLADHGYRDPPPGQPAAVVLDCFGIMHEADQGAAFARRAETTADDGVLLLQFHSLRTIVERGQWNALRHGHFAYYSLTSLGRLLAEVGMTPRDAWEFDLYGGTVLLAAQHGPGRASETVREILAAERALGLGDPAVVGTLQPAADDHARVLRGWLESMTGRGRRVCAYGAASRAVSLFSRAGIDRRLVWCIADASPAKQGRRMPGTDVPIVSPTQLVESNPDRVLLTLPELLPEVTAELPSLAGRWVLDLA